jgi:hypothetical protein
VLQGCLKYGNQRCARRNYDAGHLEGHRGLSRVFAKVEDPQGPQKAYRGLQRGFVKADDLQGLSSFSMTIA